MTTKKPTLKPEPISGFPEFLPAEQLVFQRALGVIRRNFEAYGFTPIETHAVERVDVLLAKGGNDREIYGLSRLAAPLGQDDAKEFALRFDLTVPLARYVAQHFHELTFPFRRYQIQPVWRGERPQAGRYRQFYQCDIDAIGDGELAILNDAEMPAIIYGIFREMEIGRFTIRMNNRKILQGFLESLGLVDPAQVADAMRSIDHLEKVGASQVEQELNQLSVPREKIESLVAFFGQNLSTDERMASLSSMSVNATFERGVEELTAVVAGVRTLGVPDEWFGVDPSIARGLDYYTGTIYETRLENHPGIGSICSGGRYDNLASHFIDRQLPGVGISIGLTRLIPRLLEAGVLKRGAATPAPVLVTSLDQARFPDYFAMATALRAVGLNAEVFLEAKKLGAQLKYAHRKGFLVAIIAGGDEFARDEVVVRNLATGEQTNVAAAKVAEHVKEMVGSASDLAAPPRPKDVP